MLSVASKLNHIR